MSRNKDGKNLVLAAVLSAIWCGLGQLYKGDTKKGIILLVVYTFLFGVTVVLAITIIGILLAIITMVLTLIVWAYGIYDAYKN